MKGEDRYENEKMAGSFHDCPGSDGWKHGGIRRFFDLIRRGSAGHGLFRVRVSR